MIILIFINCLKRYSIATYCPVGLSPRGAELQHRLPGGCRVAGAPQGAAGAPVVGTAGMVWSMEGGEEMGGKLAHVAQLLLLSHWSAGCPAAAVHERTPSDSLPGRKKSQARVLPANTLSPL